MLDLESIGLASKVRVPGLRRWWTCPHDLVRMLSCCSTNVLTDLRSGAGALAYALVLGKRLGTHDAEGKKKMPRHKPGNVFLIVLGTVFLWFGWFGKTFTRPLPTLLHALTFIQTCEYRLQRRFCPQFYSASHLCRRQHEFGRQLWCFDFLCLGCSTSRQALVCGWPVLRRRRWIGWYHSCVWLHSHLLCSTGRSNYCYYNPLCNG